MRRGHISARFSGIARSFGVLGVLGESENEDERVSGAGRLALCFVPDPDGMGSCSLEVEPALERIVEDEAVEEVCLVSEVPVRVKPYIRSGFDPGAGPGGGEAVGVNICAKSSPGILVAGLGDSEGVKSK